MSDSPTSTESIEIADQIELRLVDMRTGEMQRYRTNVVDLSAKALTVNLPSDGGVPLHFDPGDELIVALWKDYADHVFRTRVIRREVGRIPTLVLSRPPAEQIRRTPRREFFRVDTRITTRIRVQLDGKPKDIAAVMLDLSAGGCRLQSFTRLPADAQVSLDFALPFPPDRKGNDRRRPIRSARAPPKTGPAMQPSIALDMAAPIWVGVRPHSSRIKIMLPDMMLRS